MNLWGAAPLIAAALLGGGTGVHATAAEQVGAVTPTSSPSVSLPSTGAPMPVLQQVGTSWETTVLLNSTSSGCSRVTAAHYWLATTAPYQVIPGTAMPRKPVVNTDPAKGAPPYGSSCQVLVTFTGLGQVPETATLVVDQPGASSTVALTVSRNVTLADYLGYPAIAGLIITILSLLLSALLVWRRDRKSYDSTRDWLGRPVFGSGAWTINDSWATNISTGLVVIATLLGATTATNSLFPGVALDRFSIVNIAAGFFVVAAPVVFGILYSAFTMRHPGLTADSTIKLPRLLAATIRVPSGASITMAADTTIQDSSSSWAKVRSGGTYQMPPGAKIQVLYGIQTVAQTCVDRAEPEVANLVMRAVAEGVGAAHPGLVKAYEPGIQALRLAIERAVAHAVTQEDILNSDHPIEAIRQAVADVGAEERVQT